MITTEKYTLFWGGPFSQWWDSEFYIDDIRFRCAEQFMMYKKADLFGDTEIQDAIMQTFNPREHKALGRKVRNFDNDQWLQHAYDIVYDGNYAKFTQNEDLQQELLNTAGTTLVEASPYDKLWGIGLRETDPAANDPRLWKGHNWLGRVLTEVRDSL